MEIVMRWITANVILKYINMSTKYILLMISIFKIINIGTTEGKPVASLMTFTSDVQVKGLGSQRGVGLKCLICKKPTFYINHSCYVMN